MKTSLASFLLTLCALALLALPPRGADAPSDSARGENTTQQDPPGPSPESAAPPAPAGDPATAAAALEERALRIFAEERVEGGNLFQMWNILCELADIDPRAAIRILQAAPAPYQGRSYTINGSVDSLVARWCAEDPAAALAWYWSDAPTRKYPPEADPEIVHTLARRDPAAAADFIRRHLSLYPAANFGGSGNVDGLGAFSSDMMVRAFRAIQPWIRTPEDMERLVPSPAEFRAAEIAAHYWQGLTDLAVSALGPDAARAFLERHPAPADWPPGLVHPLTAMVEIAVATPGADPAEWLAWGRDQLQDSPELRSQFTARAVGAWARSAADPAAAAAWLTAEMDADPHSAPAAIRAHVAATVDTDPPAAMAWITAIPDETARRQNMILHYPSWAKKDPAAARAWLARSPWPEEIKTVLSVAD